jgi:soluble lytic murein transglycosylase
VAQAQGLPPGLVFAIIHQESGFDAGAISHAGARGLMQLMNGTGRELARRLGLPYAKSKLTDPEYSVRLGTTYFRQLLGMFDGKLELALASYNGGPGRILRLWRASGSPDLDRFVEGLRPEETKNYVKRILVISDSYQKLYPSPG